MTTPSEQPAYRVHQLTAENVKRLVAVDINPDGDVVTITGKNGAGKSSVLDAMFLALAGREASSKIDRPVRDGADEASVRVDLGEYIVTRTWKNNETTSVTVRSAEGGSVKSPQTMLDEMIGSMIDPQKFIDSDPKKQLAALLEVVDLPFDLDEMDSKRRALYEDRTAAGRDVKAAQGALQKAPKLDPDFGDLPDEMLSMAELNEEYRNALKLDSSFSSRAASIEATRAKIADLTATLESLEEEQAQYEPVDVDALKERVEQADGINQQITIRDDRVNLIDEVESSQAIHAELDDKINELDAEKAAALAAADMPVEGLGFDDDGVTYNGVPFSQASSAEQLRVAVAIAMAGNPVLRVLFIRDGSLLDSESMRLIAELCDTHDYQAFVERVDDSSDGAIIIENGHVAS